MKSTPEADRQCADAVLMIRPARFGANPETADSNRFQQGGVGAGAPEAARRELLERIKHLEYLGYELEAAEGTFELLVREVVTRGQRLAGA